MINSRVAIAGLLLVSHCLFLQSKDFIRSFCSGVFGRAETVSGAEKGVVFWREVYPYSFKIPREVCLNKILLSV